MPTKKTVKSEELQAQKEIDKIFKQSDLLDGPPPDKIAITPTKSYLEHQKLLDKVDNELKQAKKPKPKR